MYSPEIQSATYLLPTYDVKSSTEAIERNEGKVTAAAPAPVQGRSRYRPPRDWIMSEPRVFRGRGKIITQ